MTQLVVTIFCRSVTRGAEVKYTTIHQINRNNGNVEAKT